MTIENLIQITGATPTNSYSQEEVYSATLHIKRIDKGDLFIADDDDAIADAIKQGAHAVLYTGDEYMTDENVAMLHVEDLKEAAFALVRHIIGDDEELYFYLLRPHALSFFKQIMLERKEVEYLPKTWQKTFELILNSDKPIFISDDEALIKLIKPEIKRYTKQANGYNVEDTLFRSTFRVEKFVYQHKKMAPFHITYLLEAVHLLDHHKLPYSIDRVNYTKHFMPIFIDGETHIQKEEKNDHVVIICDNHEDIDFGREYANEAKLTMSKTIVFAPPKVKIEMYEYPTVFKGSEDLVTKVKTTQFNYGFVFSQHPTEDFQALKAYFDSFE